MAFDAFFPKITLPSNKTDVRKGGGLGIRVAGKFMVVDAFQGGEATNGLIAWLKENNAEQIDLAVATHAHGDHTGGFYDIVNAGIPIKEFRCYHIDSIRGGNDASREDSDNLLELIRWLQIRGTRVLFVDHGDVIKFEDISWHIYRNQPARAAADDTYAWEYVNNGSLVLYSPELQGIIFGDGPENPKDAIAYFQKKFGKIEILIWFLISHHGNCFSMSNAIAARNAGAQFAYESCVEADSPGTTSWTEFGARRVVQQKITVWMQNQNIYIHAAAGKITFKQGSKTLTFNIPYQGEEKEGWVKNTVGWWYRYKDGSWPADCMIDLRWSQGVSTFCFDKRGYMVTGWQKIDGKWYFFDEESGAMQTSWIFWDGSWFYLDPESGVMHTGWIDYKAKRCYLEPSGRALRNCIRTIDGKTYQFDNDCYATEISGDMLFTKAVGKLNEVGAARLKFVLDIANYVRKYAPQYGIKVYSPIIAQAIHESGWGESKLSAKYHNYFGLKCGTKWTGKSVNISTQEEYSAGTLTTISANFRAYDSMEEGVKGYFEFIQLARYSNLKGITSPRKYLETIIADGYATGKQYVDHVMNLINLYNLTQFDVIAVPTPTEPKKTDANPVDMMIQIMDAELGYHEGANNHTKYGDEMHKIQPSNMDANAAWCFAANTMILTDCGYKPIEELEIGDLVLNASGNSFNRVTNIMSREHEVCSVKAYGSIDMKATPNHPFLSKKRLGVRKDGKYTPLDFRPVSSLKKGDDVVVPVTTMLFSEDLTYDEAWVIGYFVGDGWKTSRNDYKLCGNDNKEKLIYSHITSVRKDKNYKSRTCNEYTILADSNQRIIPFLDEAGKGAENKVVPKSILFSRKETKAAFLDGYLSADGDKDSRFSTVSKKLALGISKLAFDLGYGCALWYQVRAVDQKIYDERIGKYRDIKINPIIYVGKINKADKKQNRLDRIDGTNVYVPIKSLEKTSETSTVYNISVNGDNTYLANNIAVHNCDAFFDWCILQLCKAFGYDADMAREVLCGDFDDYTYSSVNLYKRQGRWFSSPQKGDQIFFGGAGHTGGVVDVKNGEVYTDEGNKSDQVMRCVYKIGDSRIIGYGRPRYELLSGGLTAENMPLIKKGATGFAVVELQKRLNAASYEGKTMLTVDGDFGSNTYNAVKAYQSDRGLEVDGEVGKNTWKSLFNEV